MTEVGNYLENRMDIVVIITNGDYSHWIDGLIFLIFKEI